MLFDHVDLRVRDLQAARPLYDALLSAMGYTKINAGEDSAGYHRPDETGAEPFIWLAGDAAHTPNGTRLAFHSENRTDVDRLAGIAQRNGARNFEPAQLVAEYGPNYYAAFFEDAEGNKLEICCRHAG